MHDLCAQLAGKRVLVTGATGFIGGHLIEALVSRGACVYGVRGRSAASSTLFDCETVDLDLGKPRAVQAAFTAIRPDAVFHLAGLVSTRPDQSLVAPMIRNSFLPTVNLLRASQLVGCGRVVLVGSSTEPRPDSQNFTTESPYAAAKTAGTLFGLMFHRLYRLPLVCARPFVTYGPRQDKQRLIPSIVMPILAGRRPRLLTPNRVCDFIYIKDVVRGLLAAAVRPGIEGSIVELGSGVATSASQVVEFLNGIHRDPSTAAMHFEAVSLPANERVADTREAEQLLGWRPKWSLQAGLIETMRWYEGEAAIG
jgi:nucleoside-diphosphate-sugar epimerase